MNTIDKKLLKSLIAEVIKEVDKSNNSSARSELAEAFEKDLAYLHERLVQEGLWDTFKKKVGDVLDKTSEKAKEILIKPLVKVIMDRVAKDDPQGFAQLQQYASNDPSNIEKLINHPDIKKQQSKVEQELQSVKESITENEAKEFLNEYIEEIISEVRLLKEESEAWTNIKQGSKQLGKGLAQGADKAAIWGIEKGGDALKWAGEKAKQGMETDTGQAAKAAIGGLVSKVYTWVKDHPKLTASVAIGLLGAIFAAASIGSGGIVPLVTSTLTAAGGGAVKGGLVGTAVGAAKDAYSQIKGGAKSFGDMNYAQMAKAGLKTGAKGAAIGAAVGAGANVLGKAAAGVGKAVGGGNAVTMTNDKALDWASKQIEISHRGKYSQGYIKDILSDPELQQKFGFINPNGGVNQNAVDKVLKIASQNPRDYAGGAWKGGMQWLPPKDQLKQILHVSG